MTLSENLEESFHFTVKLLDDVGNLIILIILGLIPIVDFIVVGYGAHIVREGKNLDKPPKLDNYGELFVEGLKIVIVGVIYALVPAIIGSIIGLMIAKPIPPYPSEILGWSPWVLISIYLLPVLAVTTLIGIVFAIFGVMGVLHMIKTNDFAKAFAFGEIMQLIERIGWGEYLIWLIVMYIIGSIVGWLSSSVFIVGIVLGVFYIVFASRSSSHIYPSED